MSSEEAPLLGDREREEDDTRTVNDDRRGTTAPLRGSRGTSQSSRRSRRTHTSDEQTPLLSRGDIEDREDRENDVDDEAEIGVSPKKSRLRWPTLIAWALLSSVIILILGLAFAAPAVAEQYAKEAIVFKASDLSIESFTSSGVNARIRGKFMLDGSRVQKKPVRDLGRLGTWIASAVETRPTKIEVYLPQYDDILLGTAQIPALVVSIRDGKVTPIDFTAELFPGDIDGVRRIANDWFEDRLGSLQVVGKADVSLKSGIFGLGTQHVAQQLTLNSGSIPSMPEYEIKKANVHEISLDGHRAMAADLRAVVFNKFPITFDIPGMAFDVLVPGCPAVGDLVFLANATTQEISVQPAHNFSVRAQGVVRELPKLLIEMCPGTNTSPLDTLLDGYIHGSKATVYVRGSGRPHEGVPQWISDFIKDVIVPVSVPSRSFDGLIRNFTMDDTHFSLPNPIADPESPEASPRVSTTLKVVANLPEEMNFDVEIRHIRANADVFYKHQKLGVLDLGEWQKANSSRIYPHGKVLSGIAIDAKIKDAPLKITDNNLFTEVIEAMLFGDKKVILDVEANVDVETHTVLGKFVVKGVPASGRVPITRPGGKDFDLEDLAPKIYALDIDSTARDSISMVAKVNVTNPSNYSATVPFVDISVLVNNTVVGHATVKNIDVHPGENHGLAVSAVWNPVEQGGEPAREVSRNFLSQYISGYNTTLQLRTHKGTIPTLPSLGEALSNITLEIPTPRLKPPKNPDHDPDDDPDDGEDDSPHFIQDATMHLFSSSADFTLLSPLKRNTLYITHINATALYNHTEPVGFILYDVPFAVPPGASSTPRLPVEWDILSVGYEAIRQALGGTLKLDATAEVSIRLDEWEQNVWFQGGGIGAHVRP